MTDQPGSSLVSIISVGAPDSPQWWPMVGAWIQSALDHGGCDVIGLDAVKSAVARQQMQLWLILDGLNLKAAVVTEVVAHPLASTLTVIACGGTDMHLWLSPLVDTLSAFGQAMGCKFLDCHGRKGWGRDLERLGWKHAHTTWAKEIS